MALNFEEEVEQSGPSSSGFTSKGGTSVMTWQLTIENGLSDLINAIPQILGQTTNISTPGDGRVNRTPPLAHPLYLWHFASAIRSVTGFGPGGFTLTDAPAQLEVPSFPQFALYQQYKFVVESSPRSYPILMDQDIAIAPGVSYWPSAPAGTGWYDDTGTAQSFNFAYEWYRYTDYEILPLNDTIKAQQGQMTFQSTLTAANQVNGKTFTGMPNIYLPTQMLKIIWYQIPYRYLTSANSYITGQRDSIANSTTGTWRGRVNANDWFGFPAGSLLWVGYNPIKYTPPVQALSQFQPGVFSTDKLCDLELTFIYTSASSQDVPATAPSGGNLNFIPDGHNLQPWLTDGLFHYCETSPSSGHGVPFYRSFPLELLFFDPDSDNGSGGSI